MKVEELSRYGESFMEPPKAAALNAFKILLKTLKKRMGLFGMLSFLFKCNKESKKVKVEFKNEFIELNKINKGMGGMVALYVSVFRLLAKKYSRTESYEIMKEAIQAIGKYNMPLIYEVNNLIKCDGDLFENFKKLNLSAFISSTNAGVVNIKEITETSNMQKIVLDRCDGCKIGSMFDWPEIGKMGCDHDIAGYPEIEDDLNIVFRRHKTIAKGDDICDFTYYRKGTEPPIKLPLK